MAIGPVQLVVLGFNEPDFRGEIIEELDRLRENDTVCLIDAVAVYKDADGEVLAIEHSDLSNEESAEFGAAVGALIGLGAAGEEGMVAGAEAGAAAMAEGVHVLSEEGAWDVLDEIPNDSAAAIMLVEHRWAIPLRDAILRAGGFPISDGFVHPLDLVAIGLITAAEADAVAPAMTTA